MLSVFAPNEFPYGLRMSLEKGSLLPGNKGIFTGDDVFDKDFRVQGNSERAIALLDYATRATLCKLRQNILKADSDPQQVLPGRLEIAGNCLTYVMIRNLDRATLEERIHGLIDIAKGFTRSGPVRDHLLHNVTNDPNIKVRLKNLELLKQFYKLGDADLQPIRDLLEHENQDLRLRAAEILGDQALPLLLAMLNPVIEAGGNPTKMIYTLGTIHHDEARATLVKLLPNRLLAHDAAQALAHNGDARCVPALLQVFHRNPNVNVRTQIIRTLGAIGSERAESMLVEVLEHYDAPLRDAALEALLTCGRLKAAETISAMLEQGRGPKRSLRKALPTIQAHLGGEGGWLSMETAEKGGLTLHPNQEES